MVFTPDTDDEADTVTPRDEQYEPHTSPLLTQPTCMQQRIAAWDDEDLHKPDHHHQHQQHGVWLSVDEREALELDWLRQVEEVKEAWRSQAESKDRERERQHVQEREAWQAIERSRQEREQAEELIHAQRRQQWEEEDRLLRHAIEDKTQQLQIIQQQIQQHNDRNSDSKEESEESMQRPSGDQTTSEQSGSEEQPSLTVADERRTAVDEIERRLEALREEEEEVRRRMREERRQLNRDNMSLLLAIERNSQRLQQSEQIDNQPTIPQNAATDVSQPKPSISVTAQQAAQTTAASPSTPPASPARDDELRLLRQQLADERRRVEALQQRKEAAQQENRTLHSRLQQVKDDLKQQRSHYRAKLTRQQQHYEEQVSKLQQHNAQLSRTVQSLQQRVDELDEEAAAIADEKEAAKRMEGHRLRLSGGGSGGTVGRGKENEEEVLMVRKMGERQVVDEDDGLDGLVDGFKGLRQAQATLHSQLKQQQAPSTPPSVRSTKRLSPKAATQAHSPPAPATLPRSVTQRHSSPTSSTRRILVPLSPTLSTVSSICDDEADLSCCHSHVRPHEHHTAPYTPNKANLQSMSTVRCIR